MTNEHTKEGAEACDGNTAVIAKAAASSEGAHAEGVYVATCMGPREEDRPQMIALKDEIAKWEERLDEGEPEIQDYHDGTEFDVRKYLADLKRWLDAIPLELKWRDTIDNVVCTTGKNVMLDAALAGSGYTVVGPYMGLISSTSWSAVAAGDTMTSHSGWLEAGNANTPTYTAPRKTCAWSSASSGSKALSSALVFSFTGAGTVKGCFIVYFTGAVSTIDNTSGTLYSAGTFTGGDKTVANSDTLSVSYSTSL